MKPKPSSDQDVIDALAELLEEEDPEESIDDVNEELRALGLDPDAIGARMTAAADSAYRNSPAHWRNRARRERAEAERRFRENSSARPRASRPELLRQIASIIAATGGGREAAVVQAHFRNYESATDEDLAQLLSDLEFLGQESSADEE